MWGFSRAKADLYGAGFWRSVFFFNQSRFRNLYYCSKLQNIVKSYVLDILLII